MSRGGFTVGGKIATKVPVVEAAVEDWLVRGMTGTSCKCGAHASIAWSEGGAEWLAGHVATAHAVAFDWVSAVKRALVMGPKDGLAYLATLIEHEETKETLGDA